MYMFDISSFKPNQTPHGFKPMFSHRPRAPNSAIMYVYIGSTLPLWHTLQPNQDWLLGVTQTILWLGGPLAKHTSGGKGTALKSLQGPSMVFHHAHIRGELGGSAAGCWAPVTSNQQDSTYCKLEPSSHEQNYPTHASSLPTQWAQLLKNLTPCLVHFCSGHNVFTGRLTPAAGKRRDLPLFVWTRRLRLTQTQVVWPIAVASALGKTSSC